MEIQRNIFNKYHKLIEKTDRLAESLEKMHREHLQCRMGCSYCCMDYRVFPVEYYAILEQLKNVEAGINPEAKDEECIFLVNNACSIYGFRPLICRTHGLPLLYMNDTGDWELSACELNFTDFGYDFHSRNTFPQDRFNSKLFMLNREFVGLEAYKHLGEFDLIPLRQMGGDLKAES